MEVNYVVSRLLLEDAEGMSRSMRGRTFGVTCLDEECGMIEWVNHTRRYPILVIIAG